METNITINKIYVKEGKDKRGKDYKLTKLLAQGKYYITFNPELVKDVKEGANITVSYDDGDRENFRKILKIISYNSNNYTNPSREKTTSQKSSINDVAGISPMTPKVSIPTSKVMPAADISVPIPVNPNQEMRKIYKEAFDIIIETHESQGTMPNFNNIGIIVGGLVEFKKQEFEAQVKRFDLDLVKYVAQSKLEDRKRAKENIM